MIIGGVDAKISKQIERREKWKANEQLPAASSPERVALSDILSSPSSASTEIAPYQPRNMAQLQDFCQILEHFNFSNESISQAVNAPLHWNVIR
ncbi:hypothetical protein Ciccas_005317 [Cichlidogyrus casuarinus]|uniref:Uncharacterized protein n=1 Tax=Cichlidogyrus casuarinus TaxID=1844966 RepID=A0ABD2Q904_9PLAT